MNNKNPLIVYWFLKGNINTASSRLQGYQIHGYLKQKGYQSDILYSPSYVTHQVPFSAKQSQIIADDIKNGLVVIHKLSGERTVRFVDALRDRHIPVVNVQCDFRPEDPVPFLCDTVITTSAFLCDYYRSHHLNTVLIPDQVEQWVDRKQIQAREADPIQLVWVGTKGNWEFLSDLRAILEKEKFHGFQLSTISDHPQADIPWSIDTVVDHIKAGDIGVVPTGKQELHKAKSNNRATLFMALGIPVITSDLPAYCDLIQNGTNGFTCKTKEDWENALLELKSSHRRLEISLRAFDSIYPQYTLEEVGKRWENVFKQYGLISCKEQPDPKVAKKMIAEASFQQSYYYLLDKKWKQALHSLNNWVMMKTKKL